MRTPDEPPWYDRGPSLIGDPLPNVADRSNPSSESIQRNRRWLRALGATLVAVAAGAAAWWAPAEDGVGLRLLAAAVSHAILTASVSVFLAEGSPSLGQGLRWRLAFAASFVWGFLAAWGLSWVSAAAFVIVDSLGAFGGGLWATRLEAALWEDNFPPSPEVAARVLEAHRARLGSDPPPRFDKRVFDIVLAAAGGLIALPFLIVVCLAVWLEDPGPLFFVKNSVGRGGRNFRQWKIRTMVRSAEETTGPVLAGESDERVLRTGRWLRRTALDELPQLLNILQGTMSFVGPRPQRTVLVDQYLAQLPEYTERHSLAPGLAGLAQVAGDYYLTPRQKLRYDRLYVRHASLGFDLKLIAIAFAVVFWLRWKPGWDGRVPRRWLRWPGRKTQTRLGPGATR